MSIRKQYDTDLESLKNSLTEMGRNSADAVENALEALCVADADAAATIVKGDARINNMERDIEHRCMTLLLRQQPVAGDLRRISTAMKVVTDIERIGDHAADIAEIIPHLVTVRKEGDPAVSQAIAMGKKAHQMILDALDALTAEDELAARKVIAADDAVDYDFNAIKHTLAEEIAANPARVDAALDVLMVIKYLERIGEQFGNHGARMIGQRAAAQNAGVAGTDADTRSVGRHVGARLVHHGDQAQRYAHAGKVHAACEHAVVEHAADGIGQLGEFLQAGSHALDALGRQQQAIEQASRGARIARGGHIELVCGNDGIDAVAQRSRHGAHGLLTLGIARRGKRARGRLGLNGKIVNVRGYIDRHGRPFLLEVCQPW